MADTTAPAARPAYRVLGTTDDVTECDLCGRTELKGTIVLEVLDADGDDLGTVYYGSDCGARAAGWTTKDIRKAAAAADRAAREAEHAARQAARDADSAALALLRWTADCPIAPSICRRSGKGCVAHS